MDGSRDARLGGGAADEGRAQELRKRLVGDGDTLVARLTRPRNGGSREGERPGVGIVNGGRELTAVVVVGAILLGDSELQPEVRGGRSGRRRYEGGGENDSGDEDTTSHE